MATVDGKALLGHYPLDDQGVPAQRVNLVQDGILKGLLMSRHPAKGMLQSNGHGRSGFPGRETAQIGNLFIKAVDGEGKNFDELKQTLIKMSRIENLTYGLMIKSSDSGGRGPLGTPILIYKVYVSDGHEELIRGASASTLSVRELRQIEAVGNDSFVANRMNGPAGTAVSDSIVAPSVLLEEVDLKRPTATQQKPAILTAPYFNPGK
jgi:predicted Zn-dependent protease